MATSRPRPATPRAAVGGAASEAGSEYRAGVGAYLVAHGLTGTSVGIIDSTMAGHPIEIIIEADEAVDDIVCRLSGSSRILFQAKRKFGLDKHLKAAIAQWVSAITDGHLKDGDLLVAIGSEVSGPALVLASALERRRRNSAQSPSKPEQEAIDWFADAAGSVLSPNELNNLIGRARIVQANLDSSAGSLYREAARLLEGAIVPLDYGTAAMSALSEDIRQQGARRYGSTIDDWLAVLAAAHIPLFSDTDGALGARRRAVAAAIDLYLQNHANLLDKLRLSRLMYDVPPLEIEDLLDGFDVHVELPSDEAREPSRSVKLVHLVKRWRRFCLVGLPGAGKSTALEQLAADWASENGSPTPIKLSLRSLAKLCADRADLPSPIEIVVGTADFVDRLSGHPLAEELLQRLAAGTAGLLLDGLDECGAQLGPVLDALEKLIDICHRECPIVVAARHSAANAIERLRFPAATLAEPRDLESNIERLIEHVGWHRKRVDPKHAWVSERKSWVKQSKAQDDILWKVPLLATLASMLVCDDEHSVLPTNRTDVLYGAVRSSVRDWESTRERHPERYHWTTQVTAEQLLDAFVHIGHELMDARTSRLEVEQALENLFEQEWGKSRRDAQVTSVEAIRFWDEHAGVYIADGDSGAPIVPRARLFAELADAIWVSRQHDIKVRSDWIEKRAQHVGQSEPIVLATHIDAHFAEYFVRHAVSRKDWSCIRLILGLLHDGQKISDDSMGLLIDTLDEARLTAPTSFREEDASLTPLRRRLSNYDDTTWGWTAALCGLPLSRGLRRARLAIIDCTPEGEERVLALALTCISNARVDQRPLGDVEISVVRAGLDFEIPSAPAISAVKTSRRRFSIDSGVPLKFGISELAIGAAELLPDLDATLAEHLNEIAEQCGRGHDIKLKSLLNARGFAYSSASWSPVGASDFEKSAQRMDDEWKELTSIIASLDATLDASSLSLIEAWSFPDYAAVIDVLRVGESHAGDLGGAVRRRSQFERIILNFLSLYRIHRAKAAAQARLVLPLLDDFRLDIALLMYAPRPPEARLDPQLIKLTPSAKEFLVDELCTGSSYLAELAARIIDDTNSVDALDLLPGNLSSIRTGRRYLAAALLLWMRPDEAVIRSHQWLAGDDPLLRRAACVDRVNRFAEQASDSSVEVPDSLSKLLRDEDWSMRVTAYRTFKNRRLESPKPALDQCTFWSCYDCDGRNAATDEDCTHCSTGSRGSV